MSLWDDLSAGASEWWNDEKSDLASKAKGEVSSSIGGIWDNASDSVTSWFKGDDDGEKVQKDSAALIGANQKSVEQNPAYQAQKKSGINWTAASVGVGLLGLAAKFMK
jgi:hypothetical protein